MNNFLDFFHFMDKKGKVCAISDPNLNFILQSIGTEIQFSRTRRFSIFRRFGLRKDSPMERFDIRCTNRRRRVYSRASTCGMWCDYLLERT